VPLARTLLRWRGHPSHPQMRRVIPAVPCAWSCRFRPAPRATSWRARWDKSSGGRGAFGLLGTAGLPKNIVGKINGNTDTFLRTDELRQRYEQNGAEPMPGTPAEFEKVQKTEFTRVKQVIEAIGLQPQF
jgi:hypothetical protein